MVKVFYESMIDSAILLGADEKRAEEEMKEALEFEMKLAEVSDVIHRVHPLPRTRLDIELSLTLESQLASVPSEK